MSDRNAMKTFWNRLSGLLLLVVLLTIQPVIGTATPALQPLFQQALEASKQGDFSAALPLWNQFLELAPEDPAAWSNRGNVRLILGDPKGAIADQTRAMELAPAELDPHLNRGIAEEALQNWQEAADDYNWVLDRDSANSSALYNLGNVLGSQGDWSQAESLFSKASEALPGFVMARSSQALAAYQLGELDAAKKDLRKLILRYPMLADARAAMSALLWRQGSYGEAESHWAAAAGLDNRYRQSDWLLKVRRWPPQPTADLMTFLALESS